MESLRRYTLPELRQLAIYMEDFQGYAFIEPKDVRKKKCWLSTINRMLRENGPFIDLYEYITNLRSIIRWFLDHKFKFKRNNRSFFYRMTTEFIYTITSDDIFLEDRNRTCFTIRRVDMDLSKYISYITDYPTNIGLIEPSLFYNTPTPPEPLPKATKKDIIDELATDDTRALECKICLTNKICIALVLCGHTFCNLCTTQFDGKCPVCRTNFTDSTKVQIYI